MKLKCFAIGELWVLGEYFCFFDDRGNEELWYDPVGLAFPV